VLVGGVNSPVRAFRRIGGDPVMLVHGRGAFVRDVRGRAFLDFISGWGATLLGHNPPVVIRAIQQALREGPPLGLTHPAEVELARRIVEAVPSIEQVRFTPSGTEACMIAVRLARATTGRPKILVCEGGYHGHGDSLLSGTTAGLLPHWAQDTLAIPFNDGEALDATLAQHGHEIAGVIIEPVAANSGVIPPAPGFLARLRQRTRQQGILLILDEVVTGFRLAFGGAQEAFGVTPDLTVLGKIIGGGFPIGALGGPASLMRRLAPEGDVFHAGTFAGHPVSMIGGVAMLTALRAHPPYARLARLTRLAASGLRDAARDAGLAVQVNAVTGMLSVFFADAPIHNAAEAMASRQELFARWANALRQDGILVPPSPAEALFVSAAHTERHLERLVQTSHAAFRAIAKTAA
jgi:glutamate-1-semialdehyde 2,1-aminomutase